MKDKYWAKKKYSQVDPVDYTLQRFMTPAGKLIDEIEKKSVLDLLLNSGIDQSEKFSLLDVATGPGRLAFYLEAHLPKARITGVDINENMLQRARKIAEDNKSKVHFMKGDLYNLPFKDRQFDVITGLRFSMHIPQMKKVIKEFSRILKNDGVVIFDIFNSHSILQLRSMNRDRGFYTIEEIIQTAQNYKLEFQGYKGILFFGETLLRKFPEKFLFLLSFIITPPKLMERFSSKLVLCFRKKLLTSKI